MKYDDDISFMAPKAGLVCLSTFGVSQIVLRNICSEQPYGSVLLLIGALLLSSFAMMPFVKHIGAVYCRTMILSLLLLLDVVMKCQMAWFIQLVVLFHLGEFLATTLFSPSTLRHSSFLLNHSTPYHIAMVCACFEFIIGNYFYNKLYYPNIMHIGIVLAICGDILRKFSMFWCGPGFTHLIQYSKRKEHELVTDGPYGYMRHPGYAGWAIWAISTQVVLCNPICVLLYTLATYRFFGERIPHEEAMLFQFFGNEYTQYKYPSYSMLYVFTNFISVWFSADGTFSILCGCRLHVGTGRPTLTPTLHPTISSSTAL